VQPPSDIAHQFGMSKGFNSIVEILIFTFIENSVGLIEIDSFLSDMADYFILPYRSAREKASVDHAIKQGFCKFCLESA